MLSYHATPVHEITSHPLLEKAGVRLLVKREDLNHPEISGNKWWKLKYNLVEATEGGGGTILTFGGAYSNHIYATAAAAAELKLRSIGIIRGEETRPLNPTLQFASDHGMELHYITRQSYRDKDTDLFHQSLRQKFGNFHLIPEGGANAAGLRGAEEFGTVIDDIPADYVCLPVGTGSTMGGIIRSLSPGKTVIGISVLKNGAFLSERINEFAGVPGNNRWQLLTGYSYGGYGKRSHTITEFIASFHAITDIPLDFVYTGKMMCAIFDLIEKGFFEKGRRILAIHTGGLQGHS